MNELKPCPFCGGNASVKTGQTYRMVKYWTVKCDVCDASTRLCFLSRTNEPEQTAINAWNNRVEEK